MGLDTKKEMYAQLETDLGDVNSIKETAEKLAEKTGITAMPVAIRKMLRQGCKSGYLRKGTPLHTVARITRGRPLGFSPPPKEKVEAVEAVEAVEEEAVETV